MILHISAYNVARRSTNGMKEEENYGKLCSRDSDLSPVVGVIASGEVDSRALPSVAADAFGPFGAQSSKKLLGMITSAEL